MLTKKYVDLALFLKGRDLWVELRFRASWRHCSASTRIIRQIRKKALKKKHRPSWGWVRELKAGSAPSSHAESCRNLGHGYTKDEPPLPGTFRL